MVDEAKFRLYEALLKKYQDLINNIEKKTVGDIKALVNKNDLTIQSFLQQFIPEKYLFKEKYLEVLEKVYNFLKQELDFTKVDFNLNFWLSPQEILKNKIAEDEDVSVFLCSIMHALGDEKASVLIVEMSNLKSHAFVISEFDGQFVLLDLSQKTDFVKFFGEKEKVLEEFSYQEQKIKKLLYRFNNNEYEQFV
ncbi:MAG: hypothetical protein Q7K42_03715 [Candidatus Diapherotrites archaeon]|nr:hypothetical protein [Candidatus Diapherotrites archaeon]